MIRLPYSVSMRRAGLVCSAMLLLLVAGACLPWPRWCGWNGELLAQPRWRMIVTNVNERALRVLLTPLPQALPRHVVLHGQLSAITVSDVVIAPTACIAVGICDLSSVDGVGSGVRLSYDDVRASRAFSGVVRIPQGETNLHLCVAHALPDVTIIGRLGVREPANLLQQGVMTVRRFWYVMAGLALLSAVSSVPHRRVLCACAQTIRRLHPRDWLRWPAPLPPAEPQPREHAGWWLLGLIWLVILCTLFFYYYHPDRIFVNSDDGWNMLEIAHHNWLRDGVLKWWTDRAGALFIIVPQVLLEGCGLKRWIPHAHLYMWYVAACLFIGTAWLGRRVRTFLVAGPLLLALCLDWNGVAKVDSTVFSFWVHKIGAVAVLLAMGTLVAVVSYMDRRRVSALAAARVGVLAALALMQSPGNAVILGVWGVALVVFSPPRDVRALFRLALLGAILGVAYLCSTWARSMYDHAVHAHRQTSPMGISTISYLAYLQLLYEKCVLSGAAVRVLLGAGGIITVGTIMLTLGRYASFGAGAGTATEQHMYTVRIVWLLCSAALVYLLLAPANQWVQANASNIINYAIPALLLLFAACTWVLQSLLKRLPAWVCICTGAIVLVTTGGSAWHRRPRQHSPQYHDAMWLLSFTNEFGGTVPLLGDFWQTYVHSYFDPHRVVASGISGVGTAGLVDVMLPKVFSHPRVLVTFRDEAAALLVSNTPPLLFCQRDVVLVRGSDLPVLAQRGWHVYHVVRTDPGCAPALPVMYQPGRGAVSSTTSTQLVPQGAGRADACWQLGLPRRGYYLVRVRVKAPRPRAVDLTQALYMLNLSHTETQVFSRIARDQLPPRYAALTALMYHDGSTTSCNLQLASDVTPYLKISDVQVFCVDALINAACTLQSTTAQTTNQSVHELILSTHPLTLRSNTVYHLECRMQYVGRFMARDAAVKLQISAAPYTNALTLHTWSDVRPGVNQNACVIRYRTGMHNEQHMLTLTAPDGGDASLAVVRATPVAERMAASGLIPPEQWTGMGILTSNGALRMQSCKDGELLVAYCPVHLEPYVTNSLTVDVRVEGSGHTPGAMYFDVFGENGWEPPGTDFVPQLALQSDKTYRFVWHFAVPRHDQLLYLRAIKAMRPAVTLSCVQLSTARLPEPMADGARARPGGAELKGTNYVQ